MPRKLNAFSHFITITAHRHKVIKNCFAAGIGFQGLFHDLSKYSVTEFSEGVKFYQGNRSPNDRSREVNGFSNAWMHHKGRNRHHFEYWTDYDPKTRKMRPVEMPVRYIAEMFCDRVAASKIYMKENYTDSSPLEYFLKGKPTRVIAQNTSDILEEWLRILSKNGEKIAFAEVKRCIKQSVNSKN